MPFTGKATYTAGPALPEIAEDVADLIAIVSPYETPLLDHLGDPQRSATSTVHEWLEDTLLPNTDTLDGASAASEVAVDVLHGQRFPRRRSAPRRGLGRGDPRHRRDRQHPRRHPRLRRDHPRQHCRRHHPAHPRQRRPRRRRRPPPRALPPAPDASTPPRSSPPPSRSAAPSSPPASSPSPTRWTTRRPNASASWSATWRTASSTACPPPGPTPWATPPPDAPCAASSRRSPPTASTPAATPLTEATLNQTLRTIWESSSGNVDTLVVGGIQKRAINGFVTASRGYTGAAERYKDLVSVYESDFGVCRVVLSRWVPRDCVLLLDSSRVDVLPMTGRSFHYKPLAATGDRATGQVLGEYTLETPQRKRPRRHPPSRGLTDSPLRRSPRGHPARPGFLTPHPVGRASSGVGQASSLPSGAARSRGQRTWPSGPTAGWKPAPPVPNSHPRQGSRLDDEYEDENENEPQPLANGQRLAANGSHPISQAPKPQPPQSP